MRFLGSGIEATVPDAKTVWLYRDRLADANVIDLLFADFDGYLKGRGYLTMGARIADAVSVPRQHTAEKKNTTIKAGETPDDGLARPAESCQKDTDARWTKKHGKSYYGYKNHINADRRRKLVRRYQVTTAAVHDSQVVEAILDGNNTALGV